MSAAYYLDYFCGSECLSHYSDKLGSNCIGVYSVVRVHAHLLVILYVWARSFVCMHARCLYQALMGAQGDLQIKLN